jgi:hypothetical protein
MRMRWGAIRSIKPWSIRVAWDQKLAVVQPRERIGGHETYIEDIHAAFIDEETLE